MEQIAVKGWRFRLMLSDDVPDFETTFFINSNGHFKADSEWMTIRDGQIQFWEKRKASDGTERIYFFAGAAFDIIDPDQASIALPFFAKHLSALERKKS